MDRARQRFAANLKLLSQHNKELAVMGDRDWTNACENEYVRQMAKKMWLYYFTPREVAQVNKAVQGWLTVLKLREEANPVQAGGHVVKGEILSVRNTCDHPDCNRHWKMNVRDDKEKYAIYTPIPEAWVAHGGADQLIGHTVSFFAYLTASGRDPSFGFAHRPKLMTLIEEQEHAS